MVDYRKFLNKKESVVLPYFGGMHVRAKDRRLRLATSPEKRGYYRFEIEGRNARALEPADPDLEGLPKVRGHLVGDRLFATGSPPEIVFFLPEDEPALFASCTARRFYEGELVFGELDFESEVEEAVREAFAGRRGLADIKAVSAPLRAAFAFATLRRASIAMDIPCSGREAWPFSAEVAEGGQAAAEAVLERLDDLRNGGRIIVAGAAVRVRRVVERARAAAVDATLANAHERVEAALDAAGAHLHSARRRGNDQMEVTFMFGGERFVTIVNALSLQIIDAGICLVDHGDGHRGDEELTLDSLPSAIREAMDLGALVITRR